MPTINANGTYCKTLILMRMSVYFFMTTIKMIISDNMIEIYLRTSITKILFFILITPPLIRDWVDTHN